LGQDHRQLRPAVALALRSDPNEAKNPPRSMGPTGALERASIGISRKLFYNALVAELPEVFGEDQAAAADAEVDLLIDDLSDVINKAALIEDVTGRLSMVKDLEKRDRARKVDFGGFTEDETRFITIPFEAAANDVLAKTGFASHTIDDVLNAYDRHQFTIQAAITQDLVDLVQIKIANLIGQGGTPKDFVAFAKQWLDGAVSDSYARTLFRTERTSAFAAGRLAQAFDPDLDAFVVAFKYVAVGDHDTRSNHLANNGLYFDKRDPLWIGRIPPNGFNCRCRILAISLQRAESMGRWDATNKRFVSDQPPANGAPDPGFEKSPLTRIYGGS